MTPRTRRISVAAGFAAAALAFCIEAPGAGADPFTDYFEELRTTVQTRYDLLPPDSAILQVRERRDLGRVLAAFTKPSDSLAGDVRLLGRIAPRLEVSVAESSEIRVALAAAANSLATDLAGERDALAVRVSDVLRADLHERLTELVDRITQDLNGSLPVDPPTLRARALGRAQKRLNSAEPLLRRAEACRGATGPLGRGYVASRVDGTVFEARRGGALVTVGDTDLVTNVVVFGYESSDVPPLFQVEWATGMFTGVGPYEATEASGVFVTVDTGDGSSTAVQGQVLVTEFDAATRTLAGRFDVRLEDDRLISSGRFRVCEYGRETVREIK